MQMSGYSMSLAVYDRIVAIAQFCERALSLGLH